MRLDPRGLIFMTGQIQIRVQVLVKGKDVNVRGLELFEELILIYILFICEQ